MKNLNKDSSDSNSDEEEISTSDLLYSYQKSKSLVPDSELQSTIFKGLCFALKGNFKEKNEIIETLQQNGGKMCSMKENVEYLILSNFESNKIQKRNLVDITI